MKWFSIHIILVLIAGLLTVSCRDEIFLTVDSYPMNPGTVWSYQRQAVYAFYNQPWESEPHRIDSILSNYRVSIEKDTLLLDSLQVTIFKTLEVETGNYTKSFCFIDKEGFKTCAYTNGSPVVLPKAARGRHVSMLPFVYLQGQLPIETRERIYMEDPPVFNLELPLHEESYWIVRDTLLDDPFQIEKEVVSAELLKLAGKDFACQIVRYHYPDPGIVGMEDLLIQEWISSSGLVKLETITDMSMLTSADGSEVQYVCGRDTYTLTDISLK